jgi:HSP20 family protein
LDIKEYPDRYVIIADVPGLSKEEIDIAIDKGILNINVRRAKESESKDEKYITKERSIAVASRNVTLPSDADTNTIQASLKEGILSLQVSRVKKEGSKKISIT